MASARISITLPQLLLDETDRRAQEMDRARSWVVAEALRQYLAGELPRRDSPVRVREAAPGYAAAEVVEARRRHLAAELALSPEERLRRAEELGRLARQAQGRGTRHQIVGFDTYEGYYAWKKGRLIGA